MFPAEKGTVLIFLSGMYKRLIVGQILKLIQDDRLFWAELHFALIKKSKTI